MSDASSNKPKRKRRVSRATELRRAMMAAVTPKDIFEITRLQIFLALKGDPFAVREVLDRTVGKAESVSELAALEYRETITEDELAGPHGLLEEQVRSMLDSVPLMIAHQPDSAPSLNTPNGDGASLDASHGHSAPSSNGHGHAGSNGHSSSNGNGKAAG